MIEQNIILKGKFKFDIFNQDGSLSSSTDYVDNFITQTGLSYINQYALADCFRYVSLGSGSGFNSILSGGTTGLELPILTSGYYYVGGNPIGCNSTQRNEYISESCGYKIYPNNLTLFRGWRVPGSGEFFDRDYTFREFMVSPGKPAKTVYLGGVKEICHCNEQGYLLPAETGEVAFGREAVDFYQRYPTICRADKAFARVLENLSVSKNQFIVIHYALDIAVDTGIKKFLLTTGRYNPYNGLTSGGIYNWSGSSGLYGIIHYGIKLINNGSITASHVDNVTQINSNYTFRGGESYIPSFGAGLEPSMPIGNRTAYLSADNLQFFVSETGGRMINTGAYYPFNSSGRAFPSGIAYFQPNIIEYVSTNSQFIALKNARQAGASLPHYSNYTNATNYLTYSNVGIDVVSTLFPLDTGISEEFLSYNSDSRVRQKLFSYFFGEPSLSSSFPVRAIILAYKHSGDSSEYPILDMILYPKNSDGNYILDPIISTGQFFARKTLSGIYFPTGVNDYPISIPPYTSPYPSLVSDVHSFISGTDTYTSMGFWFSDTIQNNNDYSLADHNNIATKFALESSLTTNNITGHIVPETALNFGSGVFNNTTWNSYFFPSGTIPVTVSVSSVAVPTNTGSSYTWSKVNSFSLSAGTYLTGYPSWITGINYVFFTGRNINSGLYLARAFRKDTSSLSSLFVSTQFSGIASWLDASYSELNTNFSLPLNIIEASNGVSLGGYSYMDASNSLKLKFLINWSSPCSSGVIGC